VVGIFSYRHQQQLNHCALLDIGLFVIVTGQRSRMLSIDIFYCCLHRRAKTPLQFPIVPMLLTHFTSPLLNFALRQNVHSGVGSRSYIWDFKLKAEPYFIETYTTPGQAIQDYVHALQLYLTFCKFACSFLPFRLVELSFYLV
jgi:hypothetical protein